MAVTEVLAVPLHGVKILCGLMWLVCFVCLFFSACTECIEISLLVLQWRVGGGTFLLLSLSNLTRFLSARSSSSLRSFCPADLRSRILSSSRRAVCSHKLVEDALRPVLPMKMLKQYQTIVEYYC